MQRYFLIFLSCIVGLPVGAAQSDVVLTLRMTSFMQETLEQNGVLDDFEAENPGIDVVLVGNDEFLQVPLPQLDIDEHLSYIEDYVRSADVLFVDQYFMTPEATMAGFYLDLQPLTTADPQFDESDYRPGALGSLRWDNALWGLPVGLDVSIVTYDPAAFDEAGLSYPTEDWTLQDYGDAARQLTRYNADGSLDVPGMAGFSPSLWFRAALDRPFYDPTTMPALPDFMELETGMETWSAFEQEGVMGTRGFSGSFMEIPIQDTGFAQLYFSDPPRSGVLFPGGHAMTQRVAGLAVSAGTQHPEAAYKLAEFLSRAPGYASFVSAVPAHNDLSQVVEQNMPPGVSDETREVVLRALDNIMPWSELRYGGYLDNMAVSRIESDGVIGALQMAEATAYDNLETARAYGERITLTVEPPHQPRELAPGEVILDVGLMIGIPILPNQQQWDQMIADFVANDPNVVEVEFSVEVGIGQQDILNWAVAEGYDCFYLPSNAVAGGDLTQILNLDPYLFDDPAYNPNDLLGDVAQQVQRDNLTWAYPISLQPQVIWYNVEQVAQYGLSEPSMGWGVSEFTTLLTTIDGTPVYRSHNLGSTHLLMLMAAYGGLPVDYRTMPPTIDFTSPANVETIRQVLDLAKDGTIEYTALDWVAGEGLRVGTGGERSPLYSDVVNNFGFSGTTYVVPGGGGGGGGGGGPEGAAVTYRPVSFPAGNDYIPISYDIGAAYISANAAAPDACYRWIQELARHPELLPGMPANRTAFDDPALMNAQGPALTAFYSQFDTLLQDPRVVEFPDQFGAGVSYGNLFDVYWLNRAFDRYVLEDADLELELADAEALTLAYQQCLATDDTVATPEDPFAPYTACASRVDPALAAHFD